MAWDQKEITAYLLALDGAWRELAHIHSAGMSDESCEFWAIAARHGLPVDGEPQPCPECGGCGWVPDRTCDVLLCGYCPHNHRSCPYGRPCPRCGEHGNKNEKEKK